MANTGHSSPESCRGVRKGVFEALTGEDVGEPLSREIRNIRSADVVRITEGNTDLGVTVSPAPSRRGLRPSARIEASCMGTERSPDSTGGVSLPQRAEKAKGHTAAMNGLGKSDESIVSKKPANEVLPLWVWTEEQVERRDSAKGNLDQDSTSRTQCRNQACHPSSPGYERTRDRFLATTQGKSRVR